MRNMKDSTLEECLINIRIWIRNDVVMNEEDDEAERRSLPTKQIKISIQDSCAIIKRDTVLIFQDSNIQGQQLVSVGHNC